MQKKSFEGLGGQLSRTQMKAITAGKPLPEPNPEDPGCSNCHCDGGATPLPANDGPDGGICYCPDGTRISGASWYCN